MLALFDQAFFVAAVVTSNKEINDSGQAMNTLWKL